MRTLLSILLAAALALSAPGQAAAVCPLPGAVDWDDMAYIPCDPADFIAGTERLAALGASGDAQGALALYDSLYAQLVHMDTLSAIAYIHYSSDVTDEYWSGEMVRSSQAAVQAADRLMAVSHGLMDGPCADAFAAHVGAKAAEAFAAYVPMTGREAALADREAELVDTYYEALNSADAVTYPYMDQTWTMDMIDGFQGLSLAYQDYEGYLEVYYGLQEQINGLVGPLFTELVSLRAEQAQLRGYASYADYAYDRRYGRDYTGAEAQLLCDAAKPIGQAYYGAGCQFAAQSDVCPLMDAAELTDTLGRYVGRIDPVLEAPWRYMTEHDLFCLSDGEDRLPSSYTTGLRQYGSAYMFVGLTGSFTDLGTMAHEFGHFANNYYHPTSDLLADVGSFDLLEVHSSGLEALLTSFYGEIFTAGADAARAAALSGLLGSVLEGCILDEFQRRVYARPDMTLDEINRLYADVRAQYGGYEPTGVDYSWMYIHHNFESPLYYISYAVSALAAIQIWDLAQQDFAAGAAVWKAVLAHDACKESYMDVLAACGLRPFTEPGAVADICRPLLDELARLAARA